MIEEIRQKYRNAQEFFYRNYDNPKYSARALEEYKRCADVLYLFEHGQTSKQVNTPLVERLRGAGL